MSKSFLLIGGSSDIALQVTAQLLAHGHTVTILARDQTRVAHLQEQGVHILLGDALDEEAVSRAVLEASARGDEGLVGVAHLVGSIGLRPPHAMPLDQFREIVETNLVSAFVTLKIAGKSMLKQSSGRLVFTSSVAGSHGLTNHEAIAAAKGGVEAMVRAAASTYAQRGLRVNAVAPGLTDTRLSEGIMRSDAIREASIQMIPTKRSSQAIEIASTIVWLLTAAPDNLTGQILHVDGGMATLRG